MPPSNFPRSPGRSGDYSSRAVVNTVDEWLRTAGLPTYTELEERLKAQASGSRSPELADLIPEPPEFESLTPAQPLDHPLALPETIGKSVTQIMLSQVQRLILKRGITGFRKNGAFRWVCEQGEVKRDYVLLRRHGLIRSVRIGSSMAVAFATDEGQRALEVDTDRF